MLPSNPNQFHLSQCQMILFHSLLQLVSQWTMSMTTFRECHRINPQLVSSRTWTTVKLTWSKVICTAISTIITRDMHRRHLKTTITGSKDLRIQTRTTMFIITMNYTKTDKWCQTREQIITWDIVKGSSKNHWSIRMVKETELTTIVSKQTLIGKVAVKGRTRWASEEWQMYKALMHANDSIRKTKKNSTNLR